MGTYCPSFDGTRGDLDGSKDSTAGPSREIELMTHEEADRLVAPIKSWRYRLRVRVGLACEFGFVIVIGAVMLYSIAAGITHGSISPLYVASMWTLAIALVSYARRTAAMMCTEEIRYARAIQYMCTDPRGEQLLTDGDLYTDLLRHKPVGEETLRGARQVLVNQRVYLDAIKFSIP